MEAGVTLDDVKQAVDLLIAVHTPEELRGFHPIYPDIRVSEAPTLEVLARIIAWWSVSGYNAYTHFPKSIERALRTINASKETK